MIIRSDYVSSDMQDLAVFVHVFLGIIALQAAGVGLSMLIEF